MPAKYKYWGVFTMLALDVFLVFLFFFFKLNANHIPREVPQKIRIDFSGRAYKKKIYTSTNSHYKQRVKKKVSTKKKRSQKTEKKKVSTKSKIPIIAEKKSAAVGGEPIRKPPPKPSVSHQVQRALSGFLSKDKASSSSERFEDKDLDMVREENKTAFQSAYLLKNRKAVAKPRPVYDCKGEGVIVVQVVVNNLGVVVRATPGVKGSTTSDKCLLERARRAALKTKWNADKNAPKSQLGRIVYRFFLGK